MEEWESIVKLMIGDRKLPFAAYEELVDIATYCLMAGGKLTSRQVIAAVLARHDNGKIS